MVFSWRLPLLEVVDHTGLVPQRCPPLLVIVDGMMSENGIVMRMLGRAPVAAEFVSEKDKDKETRSFYFPHL